MSREVEQWVRQAAAAPTRDLDTGEVVSRARRQTMWRRAAAGVAGVAVVAIAGLLALPVGGPGPGIEVADEPDASEVTEEPAAADDLSGRTFVSIGILENGSPRELVADTVLTVTFDSASRYRRVEGEDPDEGVDADSWLRWNAGCNRHESAVVLDGDRLELVGSGMMTWRLCTDGKGEQDQWLRDFFDTDPTWTLEGRQLTLAGENIVIVLKDRASESTRESERAGAHPEGGFDNGSQSEQPRQDAQAKEPDYEAHPVGDDAAERAVELTRDPVHRRQVSERMGPGDVYDRLERMLDDYQAELGGTLAGTALPHGGRERPDVVVVERFTSGDDYQWALPSSCPGYLEDPMLTGIAWHVDLEAEEIQRVSPVFENNIC